MTADRPTLTRAQLTGCARVAQEVKSLLHEHVPWFVELPARERSLVSVVIDSGIDGFARSYVSDSLADPDVAAQVLGNAPQELTRSISLRQTLYLVKITVQTVEKHFTWLELDGTERDVKEAVVRYSRDIAFAAADMYAQAAEIRGNWDARLEALFMDTLRRPDAAHMLPGLTAALGWANHPYAIVLAAPAGPSFTEVTSASLRRLARDNACDIVTGIHSGTLLILIAGPTDPTELLPLFIPLLDADAVVHSEPFTEAAHASEAARVTQVALQAVAAWPDAPLPTPARDLLPERLMAGDEAARHELINDVYRPVWRDQSIGQTVDTYLASGRSVEGTARELFVHANTVRYRLRKVAELCGWDPMQARDCYILHVAQTVGRLNQPLL